MSEPHELEVRALELLDEALEMPAEAREGWLRERCAGNAPLLDRVRALLSREGSASLHTGGARLLATDGPVPERIGAYRITGLIGQGGMGAVYRGERATGDFDHVVAIKVVRPGVLSDALVARFAQERQTLARLAHPNIARLFDGGTTAEGEPFIVMEFVEGVPLDRWLGEQDPPLDERLRIFLAVCAGVASAHQNLIIHRDLTPSNVLVAIDGTPKIIDFGISRPPAEASATPLPSPSSLAGLSLTPGYAAPEREQGASPNTLTDVYSLGVLLDRMTAQFAEPDLAAIAAKAAANDPQARYPSVQLLAADVRAFLSGEVVTARGGGARYVVSRFVGRHKVGVLAAATALLLLVAAFATTAVSYVRAERARAEEARRFADLRSLASYMLFDLNERLRHTPGNTTARMSLAARAQRYLRQLAVLPNADPSLRLDTARGFIHLAEIQGAPLERNLGDIAGARASLDAAEEQLRLAGDTGAGGASARARLLIHRAMIALQGDRNSKPVPRLLTQAVRTLDAVPAAERSLDWHDARRTLRRAQLEHVTIAENWPALPAIAQAMQADRASWPPALRQGAAALVDTAYLAHARGTAESFSEGSADSGLARFTAALSGFRAAEARAPNDPELLYMMGWSALEAYAAAERTNRIAIAGPLIEQARSAIGRLTAIEDRDKSAATLSLSAEEVYAQHLSNTGRSAEAIATQRALIAREVARLGPAGAASADLAFRRMILGVIARKAGDRALTCAAWRDAEQGYAAAGRAGRLVEFHAGFLPGIRRNLARCATGEALRRFTDLR